MGRKHSHKSKSHKKSHKKSKGMITVHVKPHISHSKKGKVEHVKGYSYKKKDLGKPGRGKKVIPIKHEDALTKLGYSTKKSAAARHRALKKAARKYGKRKVWHMLHAQVVFRKDTQPRNRKIFQADRDWVKEVLLHG